MIRISAGLASITLILLLAAHGLGLVPDRHGAVLDGRKALCEQLAVQAAWAAQQGDVTAFKTVLLALVKRDPAVQSAALRGDGRLLVAAGDHAFHWGSPDTPPSPTHVRAPLALRDRRWAVEVR